MTQDELLNKLIYLQEKVAWLENSNEELTTYVGALVDKIDSLEYKLKVFEQKATNESAVRDLKDETPPPHY